MIDIDLNKLNMIKNNTLWAKIDEDLRLEKRIMEEQGEVTVRKMTEEEMIKYGVNEYKNTKKEVGTK